jgi:hypothetical protein
MPTAHLARHASARPLEDRLRVLNLLEITTCCSKTSAQLEPGDTVVFLPELADCAACDTGRRTPVCVGLRHVALPGPAALTCACGERKLERSPVEVEIVRVDPRS